MNLFRRVLNDESGATAIEYGILLGLIAVVLVGAVSVFGTTLAGSFNHISNTLK
jgi:pilus assembly protein Flp/PilA